LFLILSTLYRSTEKPLSLVGHEVPRNGTTQ